MKTYEITLKHDAGVAKFRVWASSIARASRIVLDAEKAPASAIATWHVVPTPKQIKHTKSLMCGI